MAIWKGPDLKLVAVNPVYEAIFPCRELIGKRPLEAFPELEGQAIVDYLHQVFKTGEPFYGQEASVWHRRSPNGPLEERFFDFAYIRINGEDGKPYGVFDYAIDVTDRVRARQLLAENHRKLEAANKELEDEHSLRDHFVATLTHDLRTPLTTAIMNAQLAARRIKDTDKVLIYLAKIQEVLARSDRMIQDLLDASRIRAGESLLVELSECDMVQIVREVCEDLGANYGVHFQISAPEQVLGYWSYSELRRAIENLCSNAAKYGDPARPVRVMINLSEDNVEFSIQNYGNIIPPEELSNIFNLFQRSRSRNHHTSGWGLGLALVKGTAESHGGSVHVSSDEENGTIFRLHLPRDCRQRLEFGSLISE